MTAANVIFENEYPVEYTSAVSTRVSNSLLIGEIFGQIAIGLTCDYYGRKAAIVITTLLIVVGGILATGSYGSTVSGMFWMLVVSRGIIGFGTGGEYPASSSSAAEALNEISHKRAFAYLMVTCFPLAFGGPFASSIFLIVWNAANGYSHLSIIWRVCFAIGCVWPLSVFYFRLKMATTELYRKGAMKKRVPYNLVIRYYWRRLIGTCGTWFLFDFITYPNSIFSGTIIASIAPDATIEKVIEWSLLLGVLSLPGILVGAYLCERIGRRNTLMIGFAGYIIFGLIVGCAYDQLSKIIALFVIFYGLMQSSGNLGPGDMTLLLPSELYATGVRGTCFGLSAAIGKTGAAIGTQVFRPIQNHFGKKWTFIVAAVVGLLGVLITFICIPDQTPYDLAQEDVKFYAYLREKGWDGHIGDDSSSSELSVVEENVDKNDSEK